MQPYGVHRAVRYTAFIICKGPLLGAHLCCAGHIPLWWPHCSIQVTISGSQPSLHLHRFLCRACLGLTGGRLILVYALEGCETIQRHTQKVSGLHVHILLTTKHPFRNEAIFHIENMAATLMLGLCGQRAIIWDRV